MNPLDWSGLVDLCDMECKSANRKARRVYPFPNMEVGDSEDIEVGKGHEVGRVKSSAEYWENKLGWKFQLRQFPNYVRVRRIK